jgi:hypothetical protein
MSNELRQLLLILAIGFPLGVLLGLVSRLLDPEIVKKYAAYSVTRSRKWHFWLFGCAMFSVLAISQLAIGRFWFAGLFSFFLVLQFYCLVQSLRTSRASKTNLQAIEEWNPRKLWTPFWKNSKKKTSRDDSNE